MAKSEWPHGISEAATAIIIPRMTGSVCHTPMLTATRKQARSAQRTGRSSVCAERDGKLSFTNEKIHDRFLKLRALGLDH